VTRKKKRKKNKDMTRIEYRENCPHRKEHTLIDGNREWGCENSVSFRLHGILFLCDDDCEYMRKYVPEKKKDMENEETSYPVASDTKLSLPYDYEGKETKDKRISSRKDDIGREYRRCSVCKRWFLLDAFPLSSKGLDGHTNVCQECTKKVEPKEDKPMEKEDKEVVETSDDIKRAAQKQEFLKDVSDVDLLQEIKRRGWKGNLQVTMEFKF
jgi:hypothetical protein